jgi:tetratricopeptide (TPR) repeat protein
MKAHHDPAPFNALALITGVAGAFFGLLVGYTLGAQSSGPVSAAAAAAPQVQTAAAPAPVPILDERDLQAYRDILARDPKNVRAATELANKLYDAGRFVEAIPYYQQAFALDARNVNLSTDFGTALWYSGRPDEALAQYAKSLAVDPSHAQTLFNVGIVRRDGKHDSAGAIEAWEKLLAANPGYADASKVRTMIDAARVR